MQTPVVEPVDECEGRPLDIVDIVPRSFVIDQLGLVETVETLSEGIVVAVALGANRAVGTGVEQPVGIVNAQILNAPVALDESVRRHLYGVASRWPSRARRERDHCAVRSRPASRQ